MAAPAKDCISQQSRENNRVLVFSSVASRVNVILMCKHVIPG